MDESKVGVVIGAGPGLGAAVAERFARGGYHMIVSSRRGDNCEAVARRIREGGGRADAVAADATDPAAVQALFDQVLTGAGRPSVVVFNAGAFEPNRVTDIDPDDFERCWRVGCLGGFLVGQRAAQSMQASGGGTIIFTGATASLRGGAGFANLAVGKFGLRALAQSMARELAPENIHVAHVIIDGQILSEDRRHLQDERGPDALLDPAAIAEQYYQLHCQHRSAWTHELDLRPWVEKF
ncbi:SDR family NAD(P)-dependent oxidoreductase [Ectothiorhodospiraceae bacterium WFHF3C12]|nr:SDR family NAD(P)-dependent oxidoreductase [Ectothiorhodospiraceae bacterium WFHF3C12]